MGTSLRFAPASTCVQEKNEVLSGLHPHDVVDREGASYLNIHQAALTKKLGIGCNHEPYVGIGTKMQST